MLCRPWKTFKTFRIAAVQACSVYLDRQRSIEKACALIGEAAQGGAQLAVFPEAFIPGYPLWAWFIPPGRTMELRETYAALHANAVTIPGPATDQLAEAARAAGLAVAIGVNERNSEASDATIFNTLLYIAPDGSIAGKHRKLIPTGGERLVWGSGDGSDLEVYRMPFGRLSGLICWENYMPLHATRSPPGAPKSTWRPPGIEENHGSLPCATSRKRDVSWSRPPARPYAKTISPTL